MKTISWLRQCKVSQNDVVSVKKDWLKLLFTPLLLLLFLCIPTSNALAEFADISFSVSAPSTVQPGETYQVTVNFTNNTGATIEDVVISTDYPAGLSFSYATIDPDVGDNTWNVGDVADTTGGTNDIYLTVADDVESGTQFENLITFAYEVGGTAQRPLVEGDLVTVREPALQVWNFNPLGVNPGDQAVFGITYRNYSDVTAENVVLTYTYPTGFTYSTASTVPDDTLDDPADPDVWTMGNVNSGTFSYIYVTLDVDAGIADDTICQSSLQVDYECTISKDNEANTSTDTTHVTVQNTTVASVTGVYLANDPEHAGTNYYTGGSFDADTGVLTLGNGPLPSATEDVLVQYTYTKCYTETLTDTTRVAENYSLLLVDDEIYSSWEIGQQPWSPDSQWIVFQSDFSGNNDIYKIKKNGTGLTQLTDYPECDNMPAWSPAGDKIAYSRDNSGTMPDPFDTSDSNNADIHVMDADGSNNTQLTTDGSCEHWAVWSPDGTMISYNSDMGTQDHWYPSLWVMDADGNNVTPLLVPEYAGAGGRPWQFWSSDSEWVGFSSTADNYDWYLELYKVKADGTELTRLTWTPDECNQFCGFSDDGESILWWSSYSNGNDILYNMDTDALWGRPILQSDGMFDQLHGQKAKWTPASRPNNKSRWAILPIELELGSNDWQIFAVSWDGTYLKQLTPWIDLYLTSPVMSPDNSAIVCGDGSNDSLYVFKLGSADTDNEGLKDWEEQICGTDPEKADTDSDGQSDAYEVDNGSDPLDPDDRSVGLVVSDDDDGLCFISTVR